MISGVVAQELPPLPRGVFVPSYVFADNDNVFLAVVTSGLDQHVATVFVNDGDTLQPADMPGVLTAPFMEAWEDGENVFRPLIAAGLLLAPILYVSADSIFTPNVGIPGFLLPSLLAGDDIIFPTPLVLDPGMLRALQINDFESFFSPTIDAAQTLFPQRLDSADVFFTPRIVAGSISPPFIISDDVFFNFATQIVFRPALVVDDARPVTFMPDTGWDGANTGVTISSDKLTAALTAPANYCGARSTAIKSSGKFYFEITLGPLHGAIDAVGILRDDQSYSQMSQFSNGELAVFKNFHVFSGPNSDIQAAGVVVTNNAWYTALAMSRGDNFKLIGELLEGDVIGIAINLVDRTAWFRLNGGHWNEDQRGNTVLLNQDPTTGIGGIPVPDGNVGPALCLGGSSGTSLDGFSGDNMTANFGLKAYRDQPPAGYVNWAIDSPFGPPSLGDSFGRPSIGIPASLDDGNAFVAMSNAKLTATHNTTNDSAGAASASNQQTGKYYFEFTIGATHGRNDGVGMLVTSLLGGAPEGDFGTFANGTACAKVFFFDGAIWSNGGSSGKAIGACVAGDVIGAAVDLSAQTHTSGGNIWFRKKSGGVISNWNGAMNSTDSDPALGVGPINVNGFNFSKTWAPCVGFAGSGTSVGDNMTANFGATPFAMPHPNGFAIWPTTFNNSVLLVSPGVAVDSDVFPAPSADTANRQLFHPNPPAAADDVVFHPSNFGGNLLLSPAAVADADLFFAPGYYAAFDPGATKSPNVTLSNGNLTATQTTVVAYTGARSLAQKMSGKYYFEVTIGSVPMSNQDGFGILTENGTYKNMTADWSNCVSVIGNGGIILANNNISGRSLGTPQPGEVVGCAIDLDIRKAWFRRNLGLWNGQAGDDPATGSGGVAVQSLVSFAPAVSFNGTVNASFTANFGVTPYAFAAPLGFVGWSGSSVTQPPALPPLVADNDAVYAPRVTPLNLFAAFIGADDAIYLLSCSGGSPTLGPTTVVADIETVYAPTIGFALATLDGVPANVTLSNGNLTATHSNTLTSSGARSSSNKTVGKFYFEVTMTVTHGDFDCVGILQSNATFINFVQNSTNCVAVYKNTGAIYANGGASGKTLGAIAAGDVIGVAVDLDARKAWLRKNGGLWNGFALTSENPNTGLGGVTIGASVSFDPAVGFGGTGTAAGDAMTANFGASAFGSTAPVGFINWTSP
jgi:hypothetical protein